MSAVIACFNEQSQQSGAEQRNIAFPVSIRPLAGRKSGGKGIKQKKKKKKIEQNRSAGRLPSSMQ